MRELLEPAHGIWTDACGVEPDDGLDRPPLVVDSSAVATDDHTDRLERDHAGQR
jgi:hypothetical protein